MASETPPSPAAPPAPQSGSTPPADFWTRAMLTALKIGCFLSIVIYLGKKLWAELNH